MQIQEPNSSCDSIKAKQEKRVGVDQLAVGSWQLAVGSWQLAVKEERSFYRESILLKIALALVVVIVLDFFSAEGTKPAWLLPTITAFRDHRDRGASYGNINKDRER